MATHKELRIGLIGTGLMGRTHSNAYKRIGDFFPEFKYRPVLKAVCARREEKVKAFAEQWEYESYETDWKKIIARDDIDAVDICTPNDTHAEIAIAAAAAGKMILCEKPLARNLEEAKGMVDAIEKSGVKNTVWYNYRRIPAVTLAKQIIDSGKLGRIFHYRSIFCKTGRSTPIFRRVVMRYGGSMWRRQAPALLATCSRTASILPCGSTGRLKMSRQ